MLSHIPAVRAWMIALLYLFALARSAQARQVYPETYGSIESSCPSRTINYITATLPQQCLRTNWTSNQTATINTASAASTSNAASVTSADSSIAPKSAQSQEPPDHTTASEAPVVQETAKPTTEEQDVEADPLSDNANFLSFEEWKAQMLQKSGQSAEHVAGTKMNQRRESRGGGINNALDGYGEDGEIEIAFGGFPIPDVSAEALPSSGTTAATESQASGEAAIGEKPQKRSKEAGTTSKHRFNYASFDCAATVLKTNPGSKGSTSILSENKDSYMINACSLKNKFVIVELCNDINIDTIVLGNFEFFSSTFRSFRVSVADRYPVKAEKWEDIGTFEARNTRGVQPFLVENMRTWGRYLRIEFLSHYGAEYYCPVSLLRVHGKTMMDDWKADVKASQGEDDDEDEGEAEEAGSEKIVAEPIKESPKPVVEEPTITASTVTETASPEPVQDFSFYDDKCPRSSLASPLVEQMELVSSHCQSHWRYCNMAKVQRIVYTRVELLHTRSKQASAVSEERAKTDKSIDSSAVTTPPEASKVVKTTTSTTSSTSISNKATQSARPSNSAASSKDSQKISGTIPAAKSATEPKATTGSRATAHAVSSIAPQDSFFRAVNKRLQQLEANSTLSLQYIEEQSRILREAFTKVEKRQLFKTSTFLETLNSTVLSELRQFRLQYDQIWQSTVLELSAQREQSQREVTALSQRLSLLADELVWQRRLTIFQFGLVMLCLVLVVFSRNAAGTSTFDLPIIQNMVNRPRFSRNLSPESPSGTPSRPSSRYERLARSWQHFRSPSNESLLDQGLQGTLPNDTEVYQLPTPTSVDEPRMLDSLKSSPEPESALRRAQSEPNLIKESGSLLDSESEEEETQDEDVYEDTDTNFEGIPE